MTTIILTIIGILLAAASALMVVYYGGDAFSSSSVGADAATIQNAGTNVIASAQLARANGIIINEQNFLQNPDYFSEPITLPNNEIGSISNNPLGFQEYVVRIEGSDRNEICSQINRNLRISSPSPVPSNNDLLGDGAGENLGDGAGEDLSGGLGGGLGDGLGGGLGNTLPPVNSLDARMNKMECIGGFFVARL